MFVHLTKMVQAFQEDGDRGSMINAAPCSHLFECPHLGVFGAQCCRLLQGADQLSRALRPFIWQKTPQAGRHGLTAFL